MKWTEDIQKDFHNWLKTNKDQLPVSADVIEGILNPKTRNG